MRLLIALSSSQTGLALCALASLMDSAPGQPCGGELHVPSCLSMAFTEVNKWGFEGTEADTHHLLGDKETHSKSRLLTCPFVRDFRCLPAPVCLCTLQFLLLKHSFILVASFPLSGLRWGPCGLCGSPEEFFQPWEGRGAAALRHVQLRPLSKSNSLIKKAWPQDSSAFWQQAERKKMIIQLITVQICSGIARSSPGKQTLGHHFHS